MSDIRLCVISLGAGVQSTTMALMASHGEITPMPDAAIFADTGWEPQAVYDHLQWLSSPNVLAFPVYRVSAGNIREDVLANVRGETVGHRSATPPFYTRGKDGRQAMLLRQCTDAYKVEPVQKRLRMMIGLRPRQRAPTIPTVSLWLGISIDEAHRAKPDRTRWIVRRWPLLDLRMTRGDCLEWLKRHGYPKPPKSACIGCPFRNAERWRELRDSAPLEFEEAIAFDDAIRNGLRGTNRPLYLHRSLTPLAMADIRSPSERGEPDLFGNEYEGMCGV